jgi:CheY-like chemotaxis protein
VADDYDSNLAVIESIFEESGQVFEIIYASDGLSAYEQGISESDLIIMGLGNASNDRN